MASSVSQSYLPSPSSSQGSSSDEQQALKRRRAQNDSNTRSDFHIAPNSNLAQESFTYEKYRVGSPPSQFIPLDDTPLEQRHLAYAVLRQLLPQIEAITREDRAEKDPGQDMHGNTADIEFVHRSVDDEPPSLENLTLLIPAVWNENAPFQWLRVVEEGRGLLVQNVRTRLVKVKLISPQLYQPLTIETVVNNPIVAA